LEFDALPARFSLCCPLSLRAAGYTPLKFGPYGKVCQL
jgi:hypothetical protein